jgi:hypothetical protein
MGNKVWGIKLGSGGSCVDFCERHHIVGVGWKMVDPSLVATGSKDTLWSHVKERCGFYTTDREVGRAVGQLFRFGRECDVGDYILYYVPRSKSVRICRIKSGPRFRDFELDDQIDIWHHREVEQTVNPIPVLDLHGSLKGGLLGPRMSFWDMGPVFETVDRIARGQSPHAAGDPVVDEAYQRLRTLVLSRCDILNDQDWECLVVDYLKAQGAFVDESRVGGNQAVIDVEARFGNRRAKQALPHF